MGIRDAFSQSADFKGLVGKNGVKISKVRHKASIEVNEEGAEAAAVTGTIGLFSGCNPTTNIIYFAAVIIVSRCASCKRPGPLEFNADHPFAYVIRDENTIYFQGHFVKPEK